MNVSYEDLQHTLRMVLNDNRGQTLTEALTLGIEASVEHYLRALEPKPAQLQSSEVGYGPQEQQ